MRNVSVKLFDFDMNEIEKLLKDIKCNGTVIIGAGLIAKRFYIGLERHQIDDKVICFAVTNKGKNPDQLFGKPVVELKDLEINSKTISCIAGHRYIAEELKEAAIENGLKNIVWVGELANKMLWGNELGLKVLSPVEIIINSEEAKYNLAVRYLAAAEFYGENDYGWNYYRKAMKSLYSEELTSSRVDKYKKLLESIKEKGYERKNNIYVDVNNRILDGFHRLAIARLLNINQLECMVYESQEAFKLNEGMYLSKDQLKEAGFMVEEIEILDKTVELILGK